MDPQLTREKRRIPWITLFSLFFPGIGHVYCGKLFVGLAFIIFSGPLFVALYTLLAWLSPPTPLFGLLLVSPFIINIAAGVDSFRLACKVKTPYYLKTYNRWYIYLLLICVIEISNFRNAHLVRENIIEAFRIPTVPMFPTIIPQDRVLSNKIAYQGRIPKRGDIVVFPNPENEKIYFVKRVVALETDTVEIRNYELYLNGRKLPLQAIGPMTETIQTYSSSSPIVGNAFFERNGTARHKIFIVDKKYYCSQNRNFPKTTVPRNTCFVLGDDRTHSRDSRWYGPIALTKIKARVDYFYYPADSWSRFGKISE